MKINDVFDLSKYDEAYKFVTENEGITITDLGNGQYQVVDIPNIILTIEEQNELIRQTRESLYRLTSDYLKADYDEAVARGSENVEELKQVWLESKDKIRSENPYLEETDNVSPNQEI